MINKRILVVDDEAVIRELLYKVFTEAGYYVHLSESAEKTFEILRNKSIMLMFLDLNLPGMSGVDLCRKIRKDNYIGIIYALTGYTDLFSLINCREVGFDDFFTKPASIELLLKAAGEGFEKLERWKIEDYNLD